MICILAFFNLELIVAGSFVLETVGDLESQPAFIVAGRFFSDLFIFWAIPEKIQIGGIEDMQFPGVLKKEHVKILGINQKRSGFSNGVQEKLIWNFYGSWFLEFLRRVTQFCKLSRGESFFSLEFVKVR